MQTITMTPTLRANMESLRRINLNMPSLDIDKMEEEIKFNYLYLTTQIDYDYDFLLLLTAITRAYFLASLLGQKKRFLFVLDGILDNFETGMGTKPKEIADA